MVDERRGVLLGGAAFALWGLFPLYWPLLEPAGAEEILAHRVLWSLLATSILVVVARKSSAFRAIWTTPRVRALMLTASVLIAVNWFTYIWGVNHGYVVETSLGYYINPLVTVLLGVFVLGERLRRVQWLALAIGFAAVCVLSVALGRPPYISLVLAFSFGTYGLLKKQAAVGPTEGIAFETVVLAPVALGYLAWSTAAGTAQSWSQGIGHVALLSTTGIVTALPLILFAGAANKVPLATLGMLQYIAPTLQFLIGVLVYAEPLSLARWIGFILVWVALLLLSTESILAMRRRTAGRTAERDVPESHPLATAPRP
ncbi:MAG: EamA family transporter RarD [Nocardioidaceae bacterium]